MKFLKLIRFQNLLMIALMQCLFHFVFLKNQTQFISLSNLQYVLFVLATVCIAAAGYVINDIMDQEADAVNRPKTVIVNNGIKESTAYIIYIVLNVFGVGLGYYLSNIILKPSFLGFFIITALLLYLYATSLKGIPVIGNIVISLLLSLSVLMVGFFDLFPAMYEGNQTEITYMFSILLDFAVFCFLINFLREVVKDLEDMKGDYNAGYSSLPIVLGQERTKKLLIAFTLVPIACLLYYIKTNFFELTYVLIYSLLFILAPLLLFVFKLWTANKKGEFKNMGNLLKITLLFGILSIAVIQINMYLNAK